MFVTMSKFHFASFIYIYHITVSIVLTNINNNMVILFTVLS